MSLQPILDSTHLPSDIEPLKAADVFKSQREALTLLLQSHLPTITTKLYSRSIISSDALLEAINENHIASVRTVSLLSVVEDKIRAEPHVFTEFVKILESQPTLRSQAIELVEKYIKGSFAHPETPTHSAISSAISRYGDYLERVYSRSSVSCDGKFPPTPSKTYVNLAVVEHASEIRDIEEVRKNTLHGRVDKLLKGKKKIAITDILKPHKDDDPVTLVFVEGPPGIGKSTLAWELCRRWDRKQYDLAVLLRLREREVQQIENSADLFPHFDKDMCQSVAKEVLDRDGKRVLFILDGYDELPLKLRRQGLLLKLLKGEGLPNCSVLVTSRPSATMDLLTACSPQIQRHVEILGFTQECVKDYASSVFSSKPEMLKDFLTYISASHNPAINSLMYIPLNAAIIVHIYRNSRRKGCPIPKTMTQVYTQLCLTLLQRYTESANPQNTNVLNIFSDLPCTYYNNLLKLAQLAFEQFEKHNVVFYSDSVPNEFVHFGLLDSVPAVYGGGGVSYNFLHLTLQEFLAAYHIVRLSNGIDVFKYYSHDEHWEVVWRFVSGLTGFQYFMNSVRCDVFVSEYGIKNLLLHCLFEGQFKFDCMAMLGRNRILHYICDPGSSQSMDRYALGYCIANCSSATSWNVKIRNCSGESFMWGLNSNHCGNGVISHLEISDVYPTCLDSYSSKILSGINYLYMYNSDTDALKYALPHLKNLTSLKLELSTVLQPTLLDEFSQSNVTTLVLTDELLHRLINSPFKKLKDLTFIHQYVDSRNIKPLCDVLFGPSSLNRLTLTLPHFTENSFDLLETNTNLTTVHILSERTPPLPPLSKILRNNQTIVKLRWGQHDIQEDMRLLPDQVQTLNMALSSNTTLKELTLNIHTSYESRHLICDPRVELDYFDTFYISD